MDALLQAMVTKALPFRDAANEAASKLKAANVDNDKEIDDLIYGRNPNLDSIPDESAREAAAKFVEWYNKAMQALDVKSNEVKALVAAAFKANSNTTDDEIAALIKTYDSNRESFANVRTSATKMGLGTPDELNEAFGKLVSRVRGSSGTSASSGRKGDGTPKPRASVLTVDGIAVANGSSDRPTISKAVEHVNGLHAADANFAKGSSSELVQELVAANDGKSSFNGPVDFRYRGHQIHFEPYNAPAKVTAPVPDETVTSDTDTASETEAVA